MTKNTKLKLNILEGDVRLSTVRLDELPGGVLKLYIDCSSKYTEILTYGGGEDEFVVDLRGNENSLRLDETKDHGTQIAIEGLDTFKYQVYHTTGRYDHILILVPDSLESKEIDGWVSKD